MSEIRDRYRVIPARGYRTGFEVQDRNDPARRSGIRHPTKREAQEVADDLNADPPEAAITNPACPCWSGYHFMHRPTCGCALCE